MTFSFRVKPHFPLKATPEFLLVDLLNNLDQLAEDPKEVVFKVKSKAKTMDPTKLKKSLQEYGTVKEKKYWNLFPCSDAISLQSLEDVKCE